MKKLIVCCDGTWNTLNQELDGVPIPTNVGKLYFALEKVDENNDEQLSYYHPGVGTDPTLNDKIFGGIFGDGINKNIMSAYRWVCEHYNKGDKLYLFGFSRGAYTARSLGGFLTICGILDLHDLDEPKIWSRVETAYKNGYREKSVTWSGNWPVKILPKDVSIEFVGVWDTVGALGIPNTMAILCILDNIMELNFHNTDISLQVKKGRHAIALDEKRSSFSPTLWTNIPESTDVKQIWFPGVHSDVGGGYPQIGLSDGALMWMVNEAKLAGLNFNDKKLLQVKPDFQDVLHDSYKGIMKFLGSQPRSAPLIYQKNIHKSALDRHQSPPITEQFYRLTINLKKNDTTSLRIYAAQEWNQTGIYMEAGETYQFEASGEWIDSSIKTGPKGTVNVDFNLEELIHKGIDIIGKTEGLWQKITNNKNANMIFTKREENYPWFALVGVIANGGNPTVNGTPGKDETFLIGEGCSYKVKSSGYFMAFANDAWNYYGNNHGSLSLIIKRI